MIIHPELESIIRVDNIPHIFSRQFHLFIRIIQVPLLVIILKYGVTEFKGKISLVSNLTHPLNIVFEIRKFFSEFRFIHFRHYLALIVSFEFPSVTGVNLQIAYSAYGILYPVV